MQNENLIVNDARVYCERQGTGVNVERCLGCGYLRGVRGRGRVKVICGYHPSRSTADMALLMLGAGGISLR